MNPELTGIVLAHGELARALVGAVEQIAGVEHALVPVSNVGCDRAALDARLREAIEGRPCVVFVDLPTGSCYVAARRLLAALPEVRVVTGVNLTMLLDFVFHRTLTLDEAAHRAGQRGARAIGERS